MTEVIIVDADHPDPVRIQRAAAYLRAGRLVAFPTETVYGLGVHALDAEAVRRLFAAKGRPATDPLIVHVGSLDAARPLLAVVPAHAQPLAARFWPGPLTLVVPRSAAVPDEVTAGLDTVAIRVPAHPVARALIDAAGIPIAAPSANLFSRPSPTTAAHVLEDLDGRIDALLDAGSTMVGVESTVLDLSSGTPSILRPGAVTLEMLRGVVPDIRSTPPGAFRDGAMPSPGLLEKHYSPRAPLTVYEGGDAAAARRLGADALKACASGATVGILASEEDLEHLPQPITGIQVMNLGPATDPVKVATGLYAAMRALDARGVDVIFSRAFPADGGLGDAIADRLRRAAAGRIVR